MTVFHTPMVTLSDGNLIPQIGLGVLRIDDEGDTVTSMAPRGTTTRPVWGVR